MTRRRDILKEPKNGGKSCPVRLEKKGCFRQNCRDDMGNYKSGFILTFPPIKT